MLLFIGSLRDVLAGDVHGQLLAVSCRPIAQIRVLDYVRRAERQTEFRLVMESNPEVERAFLEGVVGSKNDLPLQAGISLSRKRVVGMDIQ
jgi:hypothetical protein